METLSTDTADTGGKGVPSAFPRPPGPSVLTPPHPGTWPPRDMPLCREEGPRPGCREGGRPTTSLLVRDLSAFPPPEETHAGCRTHLVLQGRPQGLLWMLPEGPPTALSFSVNWP